MARKNEKLAREARIAYEKWRQYFKYNIDKYHKMHSFVLGHQWEEEEEDMLVTNKKVPLTSNKLATMGNTLLGEQQQNTPQLQVVPMTNCNEQTAHLRELIVKDIVFSNNSATVYQVAASQAFIGSFGAFLIDTEYTHAKSFDLDIVYRHFKDSSRSYWDMGAERVNKTDGMHGGFVSRMTRPKFREVFGKDVEQQILKTSSITQTEQEIALATQPENDGDDPFSWADEESITINDYYKRKFEKETLFKLSNGKILDQTEMDEMIARSKEINERNELEQQLKSLQQGMQQPDMGEQAMGQPDMGMQGMAAPENPMQQQSYETMGIEAPNAQGNEPDMAEGKGLSAPIEEEQSEYGESEEDMMTLWDEGEPVRIEDQRDIKRSKIIHYKIAGDYILDKTEFPAEQIPVIFVDQNSYYDKDGKQVCRSFFDDVIDTQRYINYLRTQSAYILKVSRYDQYIGSKKNAASPDTQRNWKDPQSIQGLLTYDESPSGAKPEQVRPPELSASLLSQYQLAIEDLYTSTGLYPTRMGDQGNEVSGTAIDARTRQGSYTTYVAFNSINRAIAVGGEIVNEMIPRVYDAERVIALMTPDEGMKNITINRQRDEYGEQIENDIRKGTYEVRLKPGPSFEGQKQQALDSLQQILQANPETFNLVADLYADNLPLANTIEIKNRLKTIVPAAVIEAGKTGKMPSESGQNQPSPEEQAMQMQQQQMQMEAQFKQQQIEIKKQELQLKSQQMQIDLEIEKQKLQAEEVAVMGEIEESKMRYLAETGRTEADTAIAHANNMVKILTHKIS